MASDADKQFVYLGRQPILDRDGNLVAFELLFRAGITKLTSDVTDDVIASATVISHAFISLGTENVLGKYRGFINLDDFLLSSDVIELLPPARIVFELLETIQISDHIVKRCKELKARGFTLALDDFLYYDEQFKPILDIVDIVKIDVQPLSREELAATVKKLREWPVKLLAEKVDSQELSQYCMDLGFDLFQGFYFAKPVIVSGKRLSPSELSLLRLLGLVLADAETNEIEALLKTQPELIVNLMRLINSVGSGFTQKITSIRDAITALGRRQLLRWLQLLLYSHTTHKGKSNEPLMQMAATRARFMEFIAELHPDLHDMEDQAFMTGILSLVDVLFNMPLRDIIYTLDLGEEIQLALLRHRGPLGDLLSLSMLFEQDSPGAIEELLKDELPWLTMEQACAAQSKAIAWSNMLSQA